MKKQTRKIFLAVRPVCEHLSPCGGVVSSGLTRGHWHVVILEVTFSPTREPIGFRTGPPQAKRLTGREQSLTHQQTIGLKIYWAWPCPPEQDLIFPIASPSQGTCTRSLYKSHLHPSEGRQKKQELQFYSLQNGNNNHRKLNKMITWITALCNSLKL